MKLCKLKLNIRLFSAVHRFFIIVFVPNPGSDGFSLSRSNQVIITVPKLMFTGTLKVHSETCKAMRCGTHSLVDVRVSESGTHYTYYSYRSVHGIAQALTSLLSNLRPSIETNLGEWITGKWNLHRPRAHVAARGLCPTAPPPLPSTARLPPHCPSQYPPPCFGVSRRPDLLHTTNIHVCMQSLLCFHCVASYLNRCLFLFLFS